MEGKSQDSGSGSSSNSESNKGQRPSSVELSEGKSLGFLPTEIQAQGDVGGLPVGNGDESTTAEPAAAEPADTGPASASTDSGSPSEAE